jgi:hypothetical protein
LDNWSKIEFIFTHKLNIDPISLRKLEYYTIHNLLKEYEEHIERENKEYEKQQRETEAKYKTSSFNPTSFKPPKFDTPSFNMPKF